MTPDFTLSFNPVLVDQVHKACHCSSAKLQLPWVDFIVGVVCTVVEIEIALTVHI